MHVLCEHLLGVDGYEGAAAAGQDFVFFVQDFGGVDVLSALDFDFAAFDAQRFVQWDGLKVFDGHLFGERDDVTQFVDFAHGVVEDAGDDASMAVARRSGVTLAEAEAADEDLAGFVERELEAHAVGIVGAADEAVVFLHFGVGGFMAMSLAGHEGF